MARPKKDNAEYFPHDADMRNDDRVKAIRRRFKHTGYAIWIMVIEYLTARDFFQFEYNELTLELMAGDFDCEVKEIQDVISYCLTLGLLQQEDGFIRCKTLRNRLEPVLLKRKLSKDRVSVTGTTQRKEKERKGEKYIQHGEGKISVIVKAKYLKDKHQKVFQLEKYFEYHKQLDDLKEAKLVNFEGFIKSNPGRAFNDDEHLYNSFKAYCISNPLPAARGPDNPYAEAQYNRDQWTDAAWRERYARQIKNDAGFREYFKLQTTQ